MEPFFELRIYEVYPNKMSDWVEFMNKEIIPFQEERGMEINGTFIMNSSDQFFEESGERKMHSEKKDRHMFGFDGFKVRIKKRNYTRQCMKVTSGLSITDQK